MKVSTVLFASFVSSVIIGGCVSGKDDNEPLKVITIDTSQGVDGADISNLFDDGIEVIKLETTPESLVAANNPKIVTEKYIIISNNVTRRISMFDRSGRFVRNIGVSGRGAGEYVRMGDFSLAGDSLYVYDDMQGKVVVYPLEGGRFREFTPDISAEGLIASGGKLWFVTNYSEGSNLISIDLVGGSRKNFLPYDQRIEDEGLAWGHQRHYSRYGDSALLLYGRNDTIFNLSGDEVKPMYKVEFVRNALPTAQLENKAGDVLRYALDNGYTYGLSEIDNSRDYLIGDFSEGSRNVFKFFYTKSTGEIILSSNFFRFNDLARLQTIDYLTDDADEFIAVYDAYVFKLLLANPGDFKNPENRRKMVDAAELLKDGDNPVMVVRKFKSGD